MNRTSTTTTTRTITAVRVGRDTLLVALRAAGVLPPDVPKGDVKLTVDVPGGGDWSHTELDIDDDCPLFAEWTITTTETS